MIDTNIILIILIILLLYFDKSNNIIEHSKLAIFNAARAGTTATGGAKLSVLSSAKLAFGKGGDNAVAAARIKKATSFAKTGIQRGDNFAKAATQRGSLQKHIGDVGGDLKPGQTTKILGKDGQMLQLKNIGQGKFMTTNLATGSTRQISNVGGKFVKGDIVAKSNKGLYAAGAGLLGLGYLTMGGGGSESEQEVYVGDEEAGYTNALTGEYFSTRDELDEDKNKKKLTAYLVLAALVICSMIVIGGAFVLFSGGNSEPVAQVAPVAQGAQGAPVAQGAQGAPVSQVTAPASQGTTTSSI